MKNKFTLEEYEKYKHIHEAYIICHNWNIDNTIEIQKIKITWSESDNQALSNEINDYYCSSYDDIGLFYADDVYFTLEDCIYHARLLNQKKYDEAVIAYEKNKLEFAKYDTQIL